MPFRELFSNLAIRRKDRKLKNSGEVDNNDQIDSTSASSPSRPRTTTKNSSADSFNIPTSASNTVDPSDPAARPASSVHQNTNLQPISNPPTTSRVLTSTQHVEAKKPLSHDIRRRIWDEAYNNLKRSEPKLVHAYEVVLSHEPEEDGSNSEGPLLKENFIEQAENDKRWSRMDQIVQNGLKDTEKDNKIRQVVGKALGGVLQLNTLISTALQATPQAALAWAGVTFAMQIFVNPASESKSNRDGIIHVISMMQWYGELSVLLLREDTVNAEESAGVRGQLERRVIRLYEALLLYLIRSVYAFNRYRLVAFIRDAVKLDDWEGSLVGVEDAENAVRQGSEAYNSHQIRRSLEEILEVAKNRESKLLRDIYSVLQQQISVQLKKEDQECIQNLRTTNPRHDKKRIEDTKGGLLSDSYRWVLQNQSFKDWRDDQQTRLLWIKGNPGKGKTMLICGIVNELEKSMIKTERLSYFFCQATDSRINNATSVLRGLLYMLLDQQPSLTSHIRKRYDKERKALFDDVNAFVALSEIFTDILQDPSLKSAYLIIDALDECEYDLPKLLGFIRQMASSSPHVKWIISSRNWPKIEEVLKKTRHKVDLSLELNDEDIYTAVKTYIKHKVSELADDKDYDEETQVEVEDYLSSNANGTYLWVALVCQNLKAIESWHTLDRLKEFPPKLDSLYDQMLKTIKDSNDADLCMRILASNAVLYRPITLEELVSVVSMPKALSDKPKLLESIIGLCGSFLTIRDGTIYFVHQSAKDYLVTDAFDRIFPSGVGPVHYEIFSRSLQAMSTLQRDIYRLRAPGYPIEQVKPPDSDPLQASRYSCIYCIRHLCDSISSPDAIQTADLQDGGKVDIFVRNKFLYWLEALSLCKGMSEGLLSMAKLDALIQGRGDASAFLELVRDARRFIMYHKQAIENCPLQAYASALLFSPTRSLIRCFFKEEEPKWITIKSAMEDTWSACLQTLEGHSHSVRSVAFSHDSAWLASASYKVVKIWNASSGECLWTLEGHGSWLNSLAFSHDSTLLASGSKDGTVKIWDTRSGRCMQTLEGHSGRVYSVAFSHDSTWLASTSDRTVKIWDTSSGRYLQTLEGHRGPVSSVAFSHNSTWLISASNDRTVKIWDILSGKCLQTLDSHNGCINSVAFSHDSTLLASASEKTVRIWDASSGKCLKIFEGYNGTVNSVSFSHNSTQLATASDDKTVKIWDISSGECLQTLEGYGSANSVAFSHNLTQLATASDDKTVKIWDLSNNEYLQTIECHNSTVNSVAFSHDSTWLASASNDDTVKIWDANTGKCLQTLEGHKGGVYLVSLSHNSTWLASASSETIKIWDVSSGKCLQTLEGHSGLVNSIAFSHNSVQLASASSDWTVKIWDVSSGRCLHTLKGHMRLVDSVIFSHDSTLLSSASKDRTVKIWDVSRGECLQTLEGHNSRVYSVAFSHDSTRLASASETIKIWDVSSGECLQTLEGHSGLTWSVAFSYDLARLASASPETVKIWDANSGECLQTLDIGRARKVSFGTSSSYLHTDIGTIALDASPTSDMTLSVANPQIPRCHGAGLGSDGEWITYNSENVVWLPSEYRPYCSAVSGKTIGIGVGSGKVWVCNFKVDDSS